VSFVRKLRPTFIHKIHSSWLLCLLHYDFILVQGRVARWFVFKPKIAIWGEFWRALDWKMLKYFMAICGIFWTFGIFNNHLVHFEFIWYIISGCGILYQEKSGNLGTGWPDWFNFRPMGDWLVWEVL
jgi:hypothetical protein